MKLAALLVTDDGKQELRELWNTLDKDGDGKVTGKEWGSAVYKNQDMMKKFFGGSTLSEIGHAFNRIDYNKDESLTWDEFASDVKSYEVSVKLAKAMDTEEGKAELLGLFEGMDKDSDGKVSSKEWGSKVWQNKELLAKYFGGASMAEIGKAFNRLDTDDNESLTKEEFATAAANYATDIKLAEAMSTDEGAADFKALWDTLDTDKDGKISSKEWGSQVYKNQDVMKKYFGGSTLSEIGSAFNRIDTDESDSLTWLEFVAATRG